MTCTRCGAELLWWPLSDHWASCVITTGETDVWTFICPMRPNDLDPYHHTDETRIYYTDG